MIRDFRRLGCSIATDAEPGERRVCLRGVSMPTKCIACSARATAEEGSRLRIPLCPSPPGSGESNRTARSEQTEYTTCPDSL